MFGFLKYYLFKRRRQNFLKENYKAEDPWSSALNFAAIQNFFLQNSKLKYQNLIDVGCGEGHYAELFASRSQYYLGVDLSEQALARAKKRCEHLPQVKFNKTDFDSLPELEQKFDGIVFNFVLDYLGFQKFPKQFSGSMYALLNDCVLSGVEVFIFNPIYNQQNKDDMKKYFFILQNFGYKCVAQQVVKEAQYELLCAKLIKIN